LAANLSRSVVTNSYANARRVLRKLDSLGRAKRSIGKFLKYLFSFIS